ncbi:DUF2306 domain-containing protein [Halomonas sp. ML-15]|uniref:DUF2306 domain-containing protein n=1 Tax=Halomonas sp. ML-15 TaxID=2773305 RepID=UPI0017478F13|nr:DUF2306 domain-containing protein [Halomonas sp. ML-15]MBD3896299.1 DUF2306 domain-containing protein [Halomonas sp. ML-15]
MTLYLHLVSSLLALSVGALVLMMRKGTLVHRLLGVTWVLAMAIAALSSFWLGGGVLPLVGHLGPIHLLSLWVLVALVVAVGSIIRGRVRRHREWMLGAYLGLVGAFAGTLMPGRWMAAQLGLWM